jgi:hypothetical protein
MTHSELDALLQGALDDTLTPQEQARLAGMIGENRAARDRAGELKQLAGLIESLGPADPPPGLVDDVLAQVSHRPYAVRPSTSLKGVTVNKKILFGLATAAAIVLAVMTYNTYPRPTEGTEATIGAAQRAQSPQIAAKDVKLGDTSTQDLLQTETFDAIMKDETLRTMLLDPGFRELMQRAELRSALKNDANLKALNAPGMSRWLIDASFVAALKNPEMVANITDANARVLLTSGALAKALLDVQFREMLGHAGVSAALAGAAMQKALLDQGFVAALSSPQFAAQLAALQVKVE